VLELYEAAPIDWPVISFDRMADQPQTDPGRQLGRTEAAGTVARHLQPQARNPLHLGALDVRRDRLYARMRPRRGGRDVLGFMQMMRLAYPARQRVYWIQDNLRANWTSGIRAFAANSKVELVPTPPTAAT
jgi:hypothetical protein